MGVGFVVGSFVVTDSLRRSVDQLFEDVTGGVDVSVARGDQPRSRRAAATPPSLVAECPPPSSTSFVSVDGVEAAEGGVGGYAQLIDLEGEPITTTGARSSVCPGAMRTRCVP